MIQCISESSRIETMWRCFGPGDSQTTIVRPRHDAYDYLTGNERPMLKAPTFKLETISGSLKLKCNMTCILLE